ncbi:hypothetical protein CTI12_AA432190 [Artemisia annua]|uniref:Uncharacterized protein n=1 Tax=Artemisia annua TaxID=35608 RepID=A0A2U1M0Y2_ARTAN|nr:hypothetical protein CTI12_AA378430 [Artemisia annua]PWA54901.1 hypothetical protein CTI12_AA432190 [Artemisia annua]
MGRRHLLYLLYTSSFRPSSTPYLTVPLPPPPPFCICKGYIHESSRANHSTDETIDHQRAPSTFEEFKRLEEERASHGVASQTIEKAKDGFLEAVTGNDDPESIKESFKEDVGVSNLDKTGNQ